MDKGISRELKKCKICNEIILYLIITIMGFIILFTNCIGNNILNYLYSIFYLIAIVSLLIYFFNKNENNYEHLIFSVINVLVGTFALLNYNYIEEYIILSLTILMYTISNTINKAYYSMMLDSNKDAYVVAKFSITFLLSVLGLFVTISFYFRSLIEREFLGYYFIAFGLISLLEPFMKILIKNSTINGYLVEKKQKNVNKHVVEKIKVKPVIKKKAENNVKK